MKNHLYKPLNLNRFMSLLTARRMIISVRTNLCLVYIFVVLTSAAIAQPQRMLEQEGISSQQKDNIFFQALSVLPVEDIPEKYRQEAMSAHSEKCRTIAIAAARRFLPAMDNEQQSALQRVFERPDNLPEAYTRQGGDFKLHYTVVGPDSVATLDQNQNGTPDFVEDVALAFENSLAVATGQLNYQLPPGDNGIDGPEYDVYVHNLGRGIYGYTVPEDNITGTLADDKTSYIQIDNDFDVGFFTKGLAGAQVTAAHELLHAIQFGYRDAKFLNEYFYYELCSSWIEDVIYDEINDYYASVPGYLKRTDNPINQYDPRTSFNYGAAIWNHFLVERFNDVDVVRQSWVRMLAGDFVVDAIVASIENMGVNFEDAFAEFALWNYFTGNRADAASYYEEGQHFAQLPFVVNAIINSDTTVVDSIRTLAAKYYLFTTTNAGNYRFSGLLSGDFPGRFAVVATPNSGSSSAVVLNSGQGLELGFLPSLSQIVVIPVNVGTLSGADPDKLTGTYNDFSFDLLQVEPNDGGERGIVGIYPSPFIMGRHTGLTVEFLPAPTQQVEVRILSSGGRVIRTEVFPAGVAASAASFSWDGTDEHSTRVASGVYIVELRQGDFIQFQKLAVIRE